MTHHRTTVSRLVIALVAAAPWIAFAQDKPGAPGKGQDSPSVVYKIFPDYDVYHMEWKEYEERRRSDLIEINTTLYELTPEEQARIGSLIDKYDQSPNEKEPDSKDQQKFVAMINERAEVVRSLQNKIDVDKGDTREAQKLLASSGLMEMQAKIMPIEKSRNESINAIRPAVEAMIGPERTREAYAQWNDRLEQARDRVAIKTLTQILRTPREARDVMRQERRATRRNTPPPQKMTPTTPEKKETETRGAARRSSAREKTDKPKSDEKTAKRSSEPKRRTTRRNTPAEKPVPLDEWEQYVRDFLTEYKCTPEQTHSALAILSELKDRAESVRKTNEKRLENAEQIKDRRERDKRLRDINAPIDRLFEQLKRRLDGLLTSHQRALKKAADKTSHRKSKKR
ncbi:MAG TPA: hypothetical protein P5081_04315 [Phycisphaerae bacterium]|nr:hypothetical protein [Phycisphaerae bacterium]HRW52085.1 hypothetical protein [Phycisphaerae bacterium]